MLGFVPDNLSLNLILFAVGLLVIIKGSDFFLDSAVWIARASGIPQMIVGATIVSLCTTLPELVSSCTATLRDAPDMAMGNAVGSVICNTGLILGLMLLFVTATIRREVFLVKGVFLVGSLLCAFLMCLPQVPGGSYDIVRTEGLTLLILFGVFMVVNYYESIHNADEPLSPVAEDETAGALHTTRSKWTRHACFFVVGGAMVTVGAFFLVEFGQRLARNLGVSEAVISLVLVALGTSLPELFTAITAVRKNAEHISVGNVFGANVLNIVLVVGASATIRPLAIKDVFLARFDIPVAIALCVCVFGCGLAKERLGKLTGALLFVMYLAYLASMVVLHRLPLL